VEHERLVERVGRVLPDHLLQTLDGLCETGNVQETDGAVVGGDNVERVALHDQIEFLVRAAVLPVREIHVSPQANNTREIRECPQRQTNPKISAKDFSCCLVSYRFMRTTGDRSGCGVSDSTRLKSASALRRMPICKY